MTRITLAALCAVLASTTGPVRAGSESGRAVRAIKNNDDHRAAPVVDEQKTVSPVSIVFPDTPAARQFQAWLVAFNSGRTAEYRAFIEEHSPALVKFIDDDVAFSRLTGGFTPVRITGGDAHALTGLLSEPFADVLTRFEIKVEAAPPHRILAVDLGPTPRPADMPFPTYTVETFVDAVEDQLDRLVRADRFSGVVSIARDGTILFARAYGTSDRATGAASTLDTRFNLASMNKMFTAVAILQLEKAGLLTLDAPISTYLPDYPNAGLATKVTVRHLLTHTGGTGDIFVPEVEARRDDLDSLDDYVDALGHRALAFEPGARWDYSNYGFVLLGRIIEVLTDTPYARYIRDYVYAPANMRHSGAAPLDKSLGPIAIGYRRTPDGGGWVPVVDGLPGRATSAGGDVSTAGDLMAFATALNSGKLLDDGAVARLTTGSVDAPFGRYAFGFKDQQRAGRRYIGHGGAAPGVNNELAIYPESGDVVIVLTNQDPPAGNRVAEFIGNRLPARESATSPRR